MLPMRFVRQALGISSVSSKREEYTFLSSPFFCPLSTAAVVWAEYIENDTAREAHWATIRVVVVVVFD
jgi:hypothetical protein